MKFQNFQKQKSDLKPTSEIGYRQNLIKIRKLILFWPKMPKFGDLGSKCSKTSVKFEINTFEIGYIQNFVKIRELILFGPKIPKFGPLGSTNLRSVHSK